MKTVTDLTAEELALVQAAREKAEQEKAAKQKNINDRIGLAKDAANKQMLKGEKQVKATHNFFLDFKSGEFELVKDPFTQTMLVKDNSTGEIYLKEDYQVDRAHIQHKETKTKIYIEEYFVSRGWRSENKGYKMYCYTLDRSNRAYLKAKTIEEKVLSHINSTKARKTAEQIRDAYIANLIETQPIPNAKIEKTYISSQYLSSPYGIEINYDNGVRVRCSINVTEVGEAILSVFSTEFPKPKIEGDTVMDKLNFISKLEF
jgi:hypothetical protein